MPPRALLLDFDGVIADTENVHVAAWQRTLALLGWDLDDGACARAAEQDDRIFLADLFRARKIEGGDVDGWVGRKQELTLALLADAPRVYPGVATLVERAGGLDGLKVGVVTTTWRANAEAVLKAAGLLRAFGLIVGKEDVTAAKPDPAPYALALSKLGVAAGDAVALEDSPTGLVSARAAGVRVVAVGHRLPQGEWCGGAPYLSDLRETDRVLKTAGLL